MAKDIALAKPLSNGDDAYGNNMAATSRKTILTLACFLVVSSMMHAATASVIAVYKNAPSPIRHGAKRLSEFTGIPIGVTSAKRPAIRIALSTAQNPKLGAQGYTITSKNGFIFIQGNDAEGAANGTFTFLRTLMIEHRKDPFTREWNVEEKPAFSIRSMQVAAYRFGASFGFAALSPDRWTFSEWKEYVDFMRLCNMNVLVMASHRVYDPGYPQSEREKWRYEVWKKVMDYCHELGIKFHWYMNPNLVPAQTYWDNPDQRADQAQGAWYADGLSWFKGKDKILKVQRNTFEFFRGMDGLELIYTDGGGLSFDNATVNNPTGYFVDATNSYRKLLQETGNGGEFVFWNWIPDIWSKVFLSEETLKTIRHFRLYKMICFRSFLKILLGWTPRFSLKSRIGSNTLGSAELPRYGKACWWGKNTASGPSLIFFGI